MKQLILEKKPASQEFTDSGSHSIRKFIHRSRGIILHEEALLSALQRPSYYWEKEERKASEVPCKYNLKACYTQMPIPQIVGELWCIIDPLSNNHADDYTLLKSYSARRICGHGHQAKKKLSLL